jgi:glycosyltransferase involved in cell wall biosynthesis
VKIDFILPSFSEIVSHGSYVHFSALAQTLQARGHDVIIRAGYASSFAVENGRVTWSGVQPCGTKLIGRLRVIHYRHLRPFHLRRIAKWFKTRYAVLADSWHMREVPRGIDVWRLQQLNAVETRRLAHQLCERAGRTTAAFYTTYALGPDLPMRRMVADARRRGALVIAGYFPFSTCPEAVRECRRAGVPVWIVPLFHALDVPHQNHALLEAARLADGVFELSPFNADFFREVVGCKRVVCTGSAPPRVCNPEPDRDAPNTDEPYCVVFGRYHAGKNVGEAIRIVDAMRRGAAPNMALKVIASASRELNDYLPSYATVLSDISSEEAMRVLSRAEALLFPSVHESFGIVCFEALRGGTPALVRMANLATRSVLEAHGLGQYLYATEAQAVKLLEAIHQKCLVLPPDLDLAAFTWDAVGQRVEDALPANGNDANARNQPAFD